MKKRLNLLTLSKEEERKIQGGMPCGGYCSIPSTCPKKYFTNKYENLQDRQAEVADRH